MKLESKTKNTISFAGFLLGLVGLASSIWIIIVESDPHATPILILSILFIVDAAYLLIVDNDKYQPGIAKIVRNIHSILLGIWMVSGLCFMNVTGTRYFSALAISALVLFFIMIYEIVWRKRIK